MPPPPNIPPPEDSDDDELDDLDDILDEFQISEGEPNAGAQGASGDVGGGLGSPDDDFARQLQVGMQDLLGEMQGSKELQDQFEHLVKELSDATAAPGPSKATAPPPPPRPADQAAANFQDRIKQTMDRMKSSGAEVDAAVADSEGEDLLSEMLKQMQGAVGEGESDEDFSKMLLNMMEQLTSKEILYEPMKELNGKYPEWLRNNEDKQSSEDLQRYTEQYEVVSEIVAKFEDPEYRDDSDKDREYIIERMQKMQAVGAPPTELMGEMGQGLDIPPDIDSNCAVQ